MKKKVCLIVDGFSGGALLAPALHKRGYPSIHLITSKEVYSRNIELDTNEYLEVMFLNHSLRDIIHQLKKYDVLCIIPGIEGESVVVADRLNQKFGLPGNDVALSETRRNKFLMAKILEKSHLQSIFSLKINSREELIKSHPKIKSFPKVIKPETSGASEDVIICHDETELVNAFESAIGKLNICGVINKAMILQPYISGDEYFINTTSCRGKHYINDTWIYQKKLEDNKKPVNLSSKLVENKGQVKNIIAPYCSKICDALGIENGPSHIELIMHNQQAYFIELGARLMGGSIESKIFTDSIGYSQLDATIDCFLYPKQFFEKTKNPYVLEKHLQLININANTSGILKFMPTHDFLQKLASYRQEIWLAKEGEYVNKTVDDTTSIGLIILQHKQAAIIEKDRQTIHEHLSEIFTIS